MFWHRVKSGPKDGLTLRARGWLPISNVVISGHFPFCWMPKCAPNAVMRTALAHCGVTAFAEICLLQKPYFCRCLLIFVPQTSTFVVGLKVLKEKKAFPLEVRECKAFVHKFCELCVNCVWGFCEIITFPRIHIHLYVRRTKIDVNHKFTA